MDPPAAGVLPGLGGPVAVVPTPEMEAKTRLKIVPEIVPKIAPEIVLERAQVRHMMAVIEPQFQRDFISLLPKGIDKMPLYFMLSP